MKKLLILLVITCSFFACQDDSEQIIGTWTMESNGCFPSAEDVIIFTESHVDGLAINGNAEYFIQDETLFLDYDGSGTIPFATIKKLTKKELELSTINYSNNIDNTCSVFYSR